MRYLLPLLLLLGGCVAGFAVCYVWIGWHIQAANGMANLYAMTAYQLSDDLKTCQQPKPLWPRRRG